MFQKHKNIHGLGAGLSAAHANFRLMLLPFGPDMVHGMTPHGARPSSPVDKWQYSIRRVKMQVNFSETRRQVDGITLSQATRPPTPKSQLRA